MLKIPAVLVTAAAGREARAVADAFDFVQDRPPGHRRMK
jgi:hypothetical protein